ncbi:unnamed protein product [Alopecurus aequalis]
MPRSATGADCISNLPDDMILLVLARLRCIRSAVRTGVLSHRWHGLWMRLTDLVFRGVAPGMIQAALSRFDTASITGTTCRLARHPPSMRCADSLLRAAALFSPAGLVFVIPPEVSGYRDGYFNEIHLPGFRHATSIELDTQLLDVRPPAAGEFPALERLSVSGKINYIDTLVTRCPCLRFLTAKFHGLEPTAIRQVLASLKGAMCSRKVAVSLIDISILWPEHFLLRDAADLCPQELVYTNRCYSYGSTELPFFHHTTSIEINRRGITFKLPSFSDKFFALQRLCLYGCNIANLGKSLSCCPRLPVLRVDGATSENNVTVHSTSLEELSLGTYKECCRIDIVTPVLKSLKMEVHADMNLIMSVSTPIVENVSWRCLYTKPTHVLGFWLLQSLSIKTAESKTEGPLSAEERRPSPFHGHVCLRKCTVALQLLNLLTYLMNFMLNFDHGILFNECPSDVHLSIAQVIEKLPVIDFSIVDLRLQAMGHVYGSTLLHLLQALPVHNAIKNLRSPC